MIQGIAITIGIILIITSRFLYGTFDITLCGDSANTACGFAALFTDILGTTITVLALLTYKMGVM